MKLNNLRTSYLGDIAAILAGAILTLAFAPFNFFPVAILSPAVLLSLWLNTSTKRAFWRGWLFGLGFFGTGVYWVFISVHYFGNADIPFAFLITAALIAILALFPALNGYFLNRYFPNTNNTKVLCAFPAIWVFLEWVRTWIFTGFPWLLIGYSQLNSPLKGYAPVFSVYGVSLAVVLSSALLVNAILKFKHSYKPIIILRIAAEWKDNGRFDFLALALIWILGASLSFVSWTYASGEPVKVSLVQGNIAQDVKWSPEQVQPTLDRYVDLTKNHWNSKIIIWPEAAVPLTLQTAADFLNDLAKKANDNEATLITGIPIKAQDQDAYYNGVISLGKGEGIYTKRQLVPFGEYVPLKNLIGPIFDLLNVPMSDFISGPFTKPILANGLKIASFICYEIAYPELVLSRDGNIDLLLTVSNDAWFGHSIAQAQHLQIGQMRALEMGRALLFVSNDGITAVINALGKVQSVAPQYESYVLTDEVQTTQGKTPWQRFGMDPILLTLLALLIIAIRKRKESC